MLTIISAHSQVQRFILLEVKTLKEKGKVNYKKKFKIQTKIFFQCKLAQKFFFSCSKIKGRTNSFLPVVFYCCYWIQDPGWIKIRIWDKHSRSAALFTCTHFATLQLAFRGPQIQQDSATILNHWA
jgi:hypothetical protein